MPPGVETPGVGHTANPVSLGNGSRSAKAVADRAHLEV